MCNCNISFDYIDFSQAEKVVITHDLDLELRNKIFTSVYLKLLNSSKDMDVRYIRAKCFIDEFSKYLCNVKVDLSYFKKEESWGNSKKLDFVLNDILDKENNANSIEQYGLFFRTLKILKYYKIEYIFDIYINRTSFLGLGYNDGIYNERFPIQDEMTIKKLLCLG